MSVWSECECCGNCVHSKVEMYTIVCKLDKSAHSWPDCACKRFAFKPSALKKTAADRKRDAATAKRKADRSKAKAKKTKTKGK